MTELLVVHKVDERHRKTSGRGFYVRTQSETETESCQGRGCPKDGSQSFGDGRVAESIRDGEFVRNGISKYPHHRASARMVAVCDGRILDGRHSQSPEVASAGFGGIGGWEESRLATGLRHPRSLLSALARSFPAILRFSLSSLRGANRVDRTELFQPRVEGIEGTLFQDLDCRRLPSGCDCPSTQDSLADPFSDSSRLCDGCLRSFSRICSPSAFFCRCGRIGDGKNAKDSSRNSQRHAAPGRPALRQCPTLRASFGRRTLWPVSPKRQGGFEKTPVPVAPKIGRRSFGRLACGRRVLGEGPPKKTSVGLFSARRGGCL